MEIYPGLQTKMGILESSYLSCCLSCHLHVDMFLSWHVIKIQWMPLSGFFWNLFLLHSETWNVMISEVNFAYTMHHAGLLQPSLVGSSFLKYCRTFKLYIIQKFAKLTTCRLYMQDFDHCIVFQCIKDILCTVVMRKYMNVQHNVLSYKPLYNHLGGNWEEFFWTHGFGVEIFGRTSLEHRCGCAIWYPRYVLWKRFNF